MDVVHIEMARLDTIEEDDIPPELPPKASSLMKELPSRMARRATLATTRRTSNVVPQHSAALHRRTAFKLKSRVMRRIEEADRVDGGFDVNHPDYDEEDDRAFSPYLYESIDFKAVPLPMSKRRMFRDSLKLKGIADISRFKKVLNQMRTTWKRFRSGFKDLIQNLELWRNDLKEVEGQFGSGVVSYFSFLRWLVFLNIFIFVLEFGFVVLPTVIICSAELPANNVSGCVYVSPSAVNASVTEDDTNVLHHVLNFFTGEGWMRNTLMFYGNYPPEKLVSVEGARYNLPLAYLLSGGAYFIFSFFFMISNLMNNLKESYIESDGIFSSSANKVFAAWDYCISDDKSAEHKHDVFVQEINSDIAEEERQNRIQNRTYKEKTILYTTRVVINLFVVPTVWTSTFFLMFQAILTENNSRSPEKSSSKVEQLIDRYGYDFLIAIAITVPNLILPLFFEFLSIFEDWGRDIELALNLWRRVFVKLPPVAVLMFMQFKNFKDKIDDFEEDGISQSACSTCWENDVSAQMYMLVWVDFVVVVMTTLGLESLRKFFYQRCRCFRKIGMQQFDIRRNVLDLVYGQCLILIGAFFNPLVPAMAVIKLVILFYVKKVSLMHNNTLPDRPYQSAKSNFTFTLLLLLSFFMCIAIVGWGITRLPPSTCGPFSNIPCDVKATIFGELSAEVNTWPRVIHDAVSMMGTAAILIPVLILFIVCLYYYRSVARAHRVVIRMLKEHLAFEGKLQRNLIKKLEVQANYERHDCADHGQ